MEHGDICELCRAVVCCTEIPLVHECPSAVLPLADWFGETNSPSESPTFVVVQSGATTIPHTPVFKCEVEHIQSWVIGRDGDTPSASGWRDDILVGRLKGGLYFVSEVGNDLTYTHGSVWLAPTALDLQHVITIEARADLDVAAEERKRYLRNVATLDHGSPLGTYPAGFNEESWRRYAVSKRVLRP